MEYGSNCALQPQNYTHNLDSVQIIANNNGEGLGFAGEDLCLGVTSENVVVIIWYDSKNNKLMCSYNTDPLTLYNAKDESDVSKSVARKGGFVDAEELLSGIGKYCQLAIDSDYNLHIAAYDGIKQDLTYIYIPSKEVSNQHIPDYSKKKVCTVDSYLSVGKELTIDVAKDASGNQIPYIGYYANTPAKPRYAYLANPSNISDGVSSDKYTGVWECTIVPTPSKMSDDSKRRINVGVWKTTEGVLRDSNYKGTSGQDSTGTNNGKDSSSGDSGVCYGNGTDNAVLAYGVMKSKTDTSTSYIETAQKR